MGQKERGGGGEGWKERKGEMEEMGGRVRRRER